MKTIQKIKQQWKRGMAMGMTVVMVLAEITLVGGHAARAAVGTVTSALITEAAEEENIREAATSVGIGTTAHTQSEIRAYLAKMGAKDTDPVSYASTPSVTAPYAPGKVSDASLKNALAMINQIRYIAGLPEVTLDTSMTETMQASALVQAVNRGLSHTPPKPSGMADSLYKKGYQGSGTANLAFGYRTLNSAIMGWMSDEDDYNIAVIGHRRWILNPAMGKTSFGAANQFYSMYAFDYSKNSDITGVAWPSQQMPMEYFADDVPWSYSFGDVADASKVKVTLTRKKDGKAWKFSSASSDGFFNVNNDWYGQVGCIIFRPNNVSYAAGDVFEVAITGLPKAVRYTVTFFDEPTDSQPKYEITLNKTSANLATLKTLSLTAAVSPAGYTGTITWSSSDSKIASVDKNGKVTAKKYGTAVITAKLSNGATATCKIQTRFYDVAGSNDKTKSNYQYYYDAVYWAADNGITTGYNGVYFGPERECERRELCIFLWRIAGCPTGYGDARDYFNDMEGNDTSTATNQAIAWAYKTGVTKGYADGGFHPYSTVTRAETMIMLYRVAGKPAVSGEITFPDVLEQNYSPKSDTYKAILWGSRKKITSGYSDGNFRPLDNCLREYIVTFLYRYSKLK